MRGPNLFQHLVHAQASGKSEKLNITSVPAALLYTIGNERYDWKYQTEPDPTRDGLVEAWPRGRVPGGSSAINGMIYVRARAADFDRWAGMGNSGWRWNDMLPIFRRMETSDFGPNQWRGGQGPQNVEQLRFRHQRLLQPTPQTLGSPERNRDRFNLPSVNFTVPVEISRRGSAPAKDPHGDE